MIWKQKFTLERLNDLHRGTMMEAIGIEITEFGEDYLVARMPVDARTVQPFGLLHGGASATLAETLGSVGSVLCLEDPDRQIAVGIEINANHLRPATKGYVSGTARPVRIGRSLHVWNIEIRDEAGQLICVSRLTIAVVAKRPAQ